MVKEATGTRPVLRAKSSAPTSSVSAAAADADRVSFHSSAGRTTLPAWSSSTMPCCWPPTESALTSASPPASSNAADKARHQWSGWTSVPSGWAVRPSRTSFPVSASRTTTLQLWVEESTPATRVMGAAVTVSAGAEQVLDEELLQLHETEALAAEVGVGVEVLIGGAVRAELLVPFARVERGFVDLRNAGGLQRGLDLGVGAESLGAFLEQQVGLHVGGRGVPHAVDVLGAAGLVVEVARAVVGRSAVWPAVFEQVHERERVLQVAVAEHQVLVELDAALAVEVDVEELALVERLGDPVGEVQAGHLLVPGFGVDAHQFGALEGFDERQGVAQGGQEDVAAGFVGLGLDGEPDVVALVGDVVAQQVHGLAVAFQGAADVLGGVVFTAFAAAPHDEGLGTELGGQVNVVQDFAQGEAPDSAVVAGEAAVLEDGVAEEVGGDHRDDHAGGAEVAEPVDGFDRIQRRAGGGTELVLGLPAHRPEAEGKLVVTGGLNRH